MDASTINQLLQALGTKKETVPQSQVPAPEQHAQDFSMPEDSPIQLQNILQILSTLAAAPPSLLKILQVLIGRILQQQNVPGLPTQQLEDNKRRRRHRTVFTDKQLVALDQLFKQTQYPDIATREQLAQALDLDEERIEVWFKNRRAKSRRDTRGIPDMLLQQPRSVSPSVLQQNQNQDNNLVNLSRIFQNGSYQQANIESQKQELIQALQQSQLQGTATSSSGLENESFASSNSNSHG